MEIIFGDKELVGYDRTIKIAVKTCQNTISLQSTTFFNTGSSEVEWCLILKSSTEGKKTYVSRQL